MSLPYPNPTYTDEEVSRLSSLPILVIYGDNLAVETGIPGHNWKNLYDACLTLIERINLAGGKARMIYLPE